MRVSLVSRIGRREEGAGPAALSRARQAVRWIQARGFKAHEKMGFHHGWGAALDQLVALAKGM